MVTAALALDGVTATLSMDRVTANCTGWGHSYIVTGQGDSYYIVTGQGDSYVGTGQDHS